MVDDKFIGYFRIPDVNISVPTYRMDSNWENPTAIAQAYTDREDSAVWEDGWTPYMVIADHVHQSFANLSAVEVGDTAIISWCDGTETEYCCTSTDIGINTGDLYDNMGVSWQWWDCELMAYTCYHANGPDGVFITKWEAT